MIPYYILLLFAFALMNLLPAMGAYYFARYLNRGGYSELFLLAFSIFFIEVIISCGIPGISGHLNYIGCGITSMLIGAFLCLFKSHAKPVKSKPFTSAERLFAALIIAVLLLRFCWAAIMHSGTDTYLYHFYYPAMWITEGRIFPVSIAGLPCEYYPVYAELLYCWLMLPFGDASFAIFLQMLSCIIACCAVTAAAKAFGFRRLDGLAAAAVMLSSSIIIEVAIMGYTDVLNGAFLLAGVAIMLIGSLRNSIKFAVMAGAMLGCSASIKYTGLLLTPILTFFYLLAAVCFRKKLWKYSLFLAGSATVAAAPCYIANFIKTGNPFYPTQIHIAGIPVFTAGIDISHPASGFNRNTWSLFVSRNIWDMNLTSGILYVILPFAVIALFSLHRKFLKKQMVFLLLAVIIIMLTVIQLSYYPALAQARQIIPLLMLSALLVIPLSNVIIAGQKSLTRAVRLAALVGLCILLSYNANYLNFIITWTFTGILALLFTFGSNKVFRYCGAALIALFIISLPCLFQIRIASKDNCNYIFAGQFGGKCMEIIWNDFSTHNKPITIASVGAWYNYMFMADMPGNRVIYVPINRKNSTHPHMFDSYTEIRNNPVPFAEWYKRLKERNVTYLIIRLTNHDFMTNNAQEFRWAKAHPEQFEKLLDDGEFSLFRLVK
ncbi:MAG: hypothetical protein PHV82_15760 [Victivallaceae bacterium]|nr:hypothetical protein [Victivallaceae bacterium]